MIGILGTVADYSDPRRLQEERRAGARFGFSGGTCVHPGPGAGAERGLYACRRGRRLRQKADRGR